MQNFLLQKCVIKNAYKMVHIKVIWYLRGNIWNTFYHTVDAFYGEIFHMCIFVPDLIE